MTEEERTRIIANEVRRGSSYAHAVEFTDHIAMRRAKHAAEKAMRDRAHADFTSAMFGAKEDAALDALALRYPGASASPAVSVPGARVHIGDASVSACWDISAAAWSANIVGGKDRYWYSDGHTTAAEALDAARAMLAESVRQMRADADQLDALLGGAEVPHG